MNCEVLMETDLAVVTYKTMKTGRTLPPPGLQTFKAELITCPLLPHNE